MGEFDCKSLKQKALLRNEKKLCIERGRCPRAMNTEAVSEDDDRGKGSGKGKTHLHTT